MRSTRARVALIAATAFVGLAVGMADATGSPVTLTKTFTPGSILANAPSVYRIVIANTGGAAVPLTGLALSDTLVAGVTFTATPSAATTCAGGSVTALGTTLALSGATLAVGASCSLSANVTSAVLGNHIDVTPASAVSTDEGITNAASASASIYVGSPTPVSLVVDTTPSFIMTANTTTTYEIDINNTGGFPIPLTGVSLSSTLPSGVVFASPASPASSCGGSASIAGNVVTLTGGTIPANGGCAITTNIVAPATGGYTLMVPASSVVTTQGITNAAAGSFTFFTFSPLVATPTFAPAAITPSQTSTYTLTLANTGTAAYTGMPLLWNHVFPNGIVNAPLPGASTTCPGSNIVAPAGSTTLQINGGTLAAGATCSVTTTVTASTPGSYVDTIALYAVEAGPILNTAVSSATLTVNTPSAITATPAVSPSAITVGSTSQVSITIANPGANPVALTGLALTQSLPTGITLATSPNGTTTCPGGSVSAVAGTATLALTAGTLASGASCTVSANVTASSGGSFVVATAAGAVTSLQGVTNAAAAQATLAVSAPGLAVTKTANIAGSIVSASQPIGYTITIANNGSAAETNATIVDTLTNATLVSGSVRVNGVAAPDGVLAGTTPIGTIAPGGSATITYTATVAATASSGTQVTNRAVASGDQVCSGAACAASAPVYVVQPPNLGVALTVDGRSSATVVLGQVVTFATTITNVGGSAAEGVVFNDTLPAGITPIPGSITTSATTRGVLDTGTISGQTITVNLGAIAANTTVPVTFAARVSAPLPGQAVNTVTVGAAGLTTVISSNIVYVNSVVPAIVVTKTASASVVSVGDRVNFRIVISGPFGITLGTTTIADQLPPGMLYAPGTSLVNGAQQNPTINGNELTWTVPSLASPLTIAYSTAIGAGAPQHGTLTNVVTVNAAAPGGAPAATGGTSASVAIVASAFGTCYPITGRVYVDVEQTGQFEHGDRGVAGVRIDLDDGESVVTDPTGRYDFPCVRQGMHALRLDEQSLPSGVVPFANADIDSERSTQRLVHRTFDDTIVHDINFALDTR